MRVLISGVAGFVGRRFARRLLDEGHDVIGVDNLCAGQHPSKWLFKSHRHDAMVFFEEDVRDFFKEYHADQYDLIIHCAAIVGGRLKIENAPLDVATDLSIDSEFFQWCVNARPPKPLPLVIYFSSSAAYPTELQTKDNNCLLAEGLLTFDTNRISLPDRTYGFAKLCGEYLAKFAVETYGLPAKIYRPFGGYGEDQSFDYPFPSIIRRIVNGENPVTVWGSGDQKRDFIYIEDIVDAVLATMNVLKPGETLNLGTGFGLSFRELARIAADTLNIPIDIINDATKPEGVFARVADPYKLEQLWNIPDPMYRLKDGIKKVAAYLDAARTGV